MTHFSTQVAVVGFCWKPDDCFSYMLGSCKTLSEENDSVCMKTFLFDFVAINSIELIYNVFNLKYILIILLTWLGKVS